ncbi:MAG TPA: hypothetical protein VH601_15515 [Bryobacteraceae bacterium]
MLIEIVETSSHREIKEPNSVHADKIEVRSKFVMVLGMGKFAAIQPVKRQSQDSSSSEVYGLLLHVLDGLTWRTHMPRYVEDGWNLALQRLGFIGDCGRLKSGDNVVSKLAYPISIT